MRFAVPLLAVLLAAHAAAAPRVQSPDAPWKTIVTAHYRIHYPAHPAGGFEPFAREVASRIEGIHAAVAEWVGHEARGPVQVVVRDPVGEANGMALPLLGREVVELWRTEPESDSALGYRTSWVELLVTHELVHIHHLTWPQRNPGPLERVVGLPVGPVARKVPRWVAEGYATLLEGRLTGSGRPFGPYRAALLRQWAVEGKLPGYDSLSRTSGFRGGSMAYLVGSAYLEWLERRSPDGSGALKRLWRQLASPRRRGFARSFEAAFGLSPRDGYDRFRAEVTRDALETERSLSAAGLCEGEPWARTVGEVTDLAVSPDGTRLLARVLSPRGSALRVYALRDAPKQGVGRRGPDRAKDPYDEEDLPPAFPSREAAATLPRVNGAVPERPSWRDDRRVALSLKEPDGEGVLVRRPFVWTPGAGLRRAEAEEVAPPALRVTAEGDRAIAVRGEERIDLPFTPVGKLATDGTGSFLYGATAVDGIWNLVRVALRTEGGRTVAGSVEVLTRTTSAAWNPAPSPDGAELFFTRLAATGVEIRRLALGMGAALPPAPLQIPEPFTTGAVLAPPPGTDLLPPAVPPPPAAPYRPSAAMQVSARSGLSIAPSGTAVQVGAGGSDVLGQLGWQLLAGLGDAAGPRGARAEAVFRGFRWTPSVTAFAALERPSAQRFVPVEGYDRQRAGAELSFTFSDRSPLGVEVLPSLAWERVTPADGDGQAVDRLVATVSASLSRRVSRGEVWGVSFSARGTGQAGRSDGDGWGLLRGTVALGLSTPAGPFRGEVEAGGLSSEATDLDRFRLGGPASPLVPRSLEAGLVEQAALPSFLASGDRLLRLRATWGRAVRASLEHAAVWSGGTDRPPFVRVASLELAVHELVGEPLLVPVVGRLTLVAGVHRPLDGEMRGRTVATVTLATSP